jgi:molybdopterin-guanine dinucleotide biosynthesis protein A
LCAHFCAFRSVHQTGAIPTILERIVEELRIAFDDIEIMAAPRESEVFPIEHLLQGAAAPVHLLRDRGPFEGAAVALARGLAAVADDIALVYSCDLPLLRCGLAIALCEMLDGYDAVIPDIDGQPQPLCAVYRRSAASVIEQQLSSGERRLTHITAALEAYRPGEAELRQFDPDLRSFLNVNTVKPMSAHLRSNDRVTDRSSSVVSHQ